MKWLGQWSVVTVRIMTVLAHHRITRHLIMIERLVKR